MFNSDFDIFPQLISGQTIKCSVGQLTSIVTFVFNKNIYCAEAGGKKYYKTCEIMAVEAGHLIQINYHKKFLLNFILKNTYL